MSLGGHARQTPDKGIHVAVSWTFADSDSRTAFVPTSGIPAVAQQLTNEDLGKFAWDLDTDTVYLLKSLSPTTWVPVGGVVPSTALVAGAGLDGGGALTGDISFDVVANVDGSIVVNPDDIQVGVLATDAQHGNRGGGTTHAVATASAPGFMSDTDKAKLDGVASGSAALTGTAPVNVAKSAAAVGVGTAAARHDHKHDVSTAAAVALTDSTNAEGTATSLARSDHTHSHGTRAGGALHALATTSTAGFMSAADKTFLGLVGVISSFSTGTTSTSGSTPVTKTSIVIPAEDQTFIVEGSALVSVSDTMANAAVRLRNTTSGVTLSTRVFDAEVRGTISVSIRVEFVQTIGAGAQTVGIEYYIASGSGTIDVSDALVTARRKI